MKKLIALSFVVLVAGCADRPGSDERSLNWANDCDRNFSYDSREYSLCKERVAAHETVQEHSGQVVVNPNNAYNPTESQTHKNRD